MYCESIEVWTVSPCPLCQGVMLCLAEEKLPNEFFPISDFDDSLMLSSLGFHFNLIFFYITDLFCSIFLNSQFNTENDVEVLIFKGSWTAQKK